MMISSTKNCFFCGCSSEVESSRKPKMDMTLYHCPNCGHYILDGSLKKELIEKKNRSMRKRLACIAAEKHLKKQDGYTLLLDQDVKEKTNNVFGIFDFIADFPSKPIDRFNRALLNLGRVAKDNPFDEIMQNDLVNYAMFTTSNNEANRVVSFLEQDGWIGERKEGVASGLKPIPPSFVITPKGWAKIAELEEQYKEHSNKAFLAMWFDKSTIAFREAVRIAAEQAGYILGVVDEEHHNDFIMNKVLNMIDESKFIIADFTCKEEEPGDGKIKGGVRGGVYYEAGFAEGQGKEVIMTCRADDDSWNRRHFDIEQKNTIFWKEDENGKIVTSNGDFDFIEYLKERIVRSVGKGPDYKENKKENI